MGASPVVNSKLRTLTVLDKPTNLTFENIKELLANYLNPKPLAYTERQRFRSRRQGEKKPFSDFLSNLKEISVNCNFQGEHRLNEELRDSCLLGPDVLVKMLNQLS